MRSKTPVLPALRALAAVVLLSLVGAACTSSDRTVADDATTTTTSESDGGVVFLQGVGAEEIDPFSESVAVVEVDEFAPAVRSAIESALTSAGSDSSTRTRSLRGDTPGLYGGSGDDAVCDLVALGEFLLDEAQADKADAFADIVGVDVDDLAEYLDDLTPVLLTTDTLVTNHGYSDGAATPFPAVLQAGTAVAVDANGVPRVKCGCGNPLAPADNTVELGPDTATTGDEWDRYEPADVAIVEPSDDEVDDFTVIDIESGSMYDIPTGSSGGFASDGASPDECFIDADGHGPDCDPVDEGGMSGPGAGPDECFIDADGHGPDCDPVDEGGVSGPGAGPDECFIDADGHGPDCDLGGAGGADDLRFMSGWDATAAGLAEYTMFTVTCEPNGTLGPVYGSGPYESNSSICTAAVHTGRITAAAGGTVGGQVVPLSGAMSGSSANGVSSKSSANPAGAFEIF